jgi:hypothetical protein
MHRLQGQNGDHALYQKRYRLHQAKHERHLLGREGQEAGDGKKDERWPAGSALSALPTPSDRDKQALTKHGAEPDEQESRRR